MECEICGEDILHQCKLSLVLGTEEENKNYEKYENMQICKPCFLHILYSVKQKEIRREVFYK